MKKKPKQNNDGKSLNPENLTPSRATIEEMKSLGFLEAIVHADIILAYPTCPEEKMQIAYGVQKLQQIVSGGVARLASTVCVVVDWSTDEPEYLNALIDVIKGSCELNLSHRHFATADELD